MVDFIEEIVESSYKSDNAFMASYIDYYYNFNFVDIEKELERKIIINNLQTLPSDYFSGKNVGAVAGMGGTAAVTGTIIITLLVPIISKTSFQSFFIVAALLVPLGWMCIYFLTNNDVKK